MKITVGFFPNETSGSRIDMFEFKPVPAWQIKLFTAAQLIQPILDTPSLSSATRLALNGERIMRNAEDQRARGELEIADAFRRR
jgi:hypothetical protein